MEKNQRAHFFELKEKAMRLLETAKAENRSLSDEEKATYSQLEAEIQLAKAEAAEREFSQHQASVNDTARHFAEAISSLNPGDSLKVRDYAGNDRASVAADTPLYIGDIIEPLEKGNILGMLGCKMQTGLHGDWKYPVLSAVEAEVAGETAEIADKKIDFDAVQPVPRRVALSILVSRQALNAANDDLHDIVTTQIIAGLDRTLNKWMFQRTAIVTGVNGLFVAPGTQTQMATAGAPTYAEILALKAAVDSKGVKPDQTAAYVMTNAMRAVLEGTPKASGHGEMICENGKINGVPVYVTEYAPANAVEFGYFSYALVGQFGQTELIYDPLTKATSNSVRFVLNTEFDIKPARAQAFGILYSASAAA